MDDNLEVFKRMMASADPDKTDIMDYEPIDDSILRKNKAERESVEAAKANLKRTLDPAKRDMPAMDSKRGREILENIKEQSKKRLSSGVPIDTVGDGTRSAVKRSALNKMLKRVGAKAAGLALGPIGLVASGAAEAFDAEELGKGSDEMRQEEMLKQIERFKEMGAMEDGGMAMDKEARKKALLEKAIRNRAKRMEAARRENELMRIADTIVDDTEEDKKYQAEQEANERRLKTLYSAMEDAKTPEFKERIRQLIMRRR
jgi:hypothetical protein